MHQHLEGKVAVVTGAASGMGAAMTRLFAAEGATVVAGDVNQERLDAVASEVEGAGGVVTTVVGDVASREGANKLIDTATQQHGRLDVLCNNAGVMDQFQGVASLDDQTWNKVMAVNLYAPMALSRAAVQWMKDHGGGSIVNSSSAAGVGGGAAGAAYTASKHGVIGLTKNTAVTYAPHGIRANAIVIGAVATNIQETITPEKIDQEAMGQYGGWHGLAPATLEPDDVAQLALFLASDASKRINGAAIAADAGWMAY